METSTKVCTGCAEEKVLEDFNRKHTGRFGRDSRCKVCISERDKKALPKSNARRRKRYKESPEYREKILARNSEWQKENLDHRNEYNANWKEKNPEKAKEYWNKHYQKNKKKYFFRAKLRKEKIKRATPSWVNIEDIQKVYDLCRKISEATGVPHEVDHAIPLKGKNVCGLHTFKNLQIVPQTMNRQKSNKFEPDRQREWE